MWYAVVGVVSFGAGVFLHSWITKPFQKFEAKLDAALKAFKA